MKVTVPVQCSCGNQFPTEGYGTKDFPVAVCPKCGNLIHILDPLSISVLADRLLYRSRSEMEGGDCTLSILCSAIAVECALTHVFLKWKAIESGRLTVQSATEAERGAWEKEYQREPQKRGFKFRNFSMSADFVSKFLTGETFNDFAADFAKKSHMPKLIHAGFPPTTSSQLKVDYAQNEIFDKRNRIMHWADVSYQKADAAVALDAAARFIAILKVMDREKADAKERAWRNSLAVSHATP